MAVALIRIDERLLHGQVIVGWGERLDLRWYVVADDELAEATWEQEIYAAGLPPRAEARFLTVEEAREALPSLDDRAEPGAVLTRGTEAMRRLADGGLLEGRRVNLGCLAGDPGRREALSYVHLSPGEAEDLRALARAGASVSARDVPDARSVVLEEVLDALGD